MSEVSGTFSHLSEEHEKKNITDKKIKQKVIVLFMPSVK